MTTMKAFARMDSESLLVKMITVSVPDISDDEVLVSMDAFGVGVHDRYFIPTSTAFPYVIGIEGAGRIAATGSQVNGFVVGDRVVFTSSMQPKGGTWAEYAAVKQTALIAIPDHLSSAEAATVPVAGRTALQGLSDLDLHSGNTLFIAGASGAIGTFAIQLATAKGIRVVGSASANNLQYMKSLGAQKAVDYNDPDWQIDVKEWSGGGVDAALAIQPGTERTATKVVRDAGKVVTVSSYSNEQALTERNIVVAQLEHQDATYEKVAHLVSSIADKSIRTVIEAEYAFDKALDALEKTETRHARGKRVVLIKD